MYNIEFIFFKTSKFQFVFVRNLLKTNRYIYFVDFDRDSI